MTSEVETLVEAMLEEELASAEREALDGLAPLPKQSLESWINGTPAKGFERFRSCDLPLVHRFAEVWLAEAVELLRPTFRAAGHEIPPVHVSIGFTSTGYRFGSKRYTQGMCYARRLSIDGINEIYIAPVVKSAEGVMDLLMHELIHAVLDCKHGHGPEFQKIATDIFLVDAKNLTLKQTLKSMLDQRRLIAQLGRFPRKGMHRQTVAP